MPRARYINQDQRLTAAAYENGSGCLSVYWLPPFAAILIACLLAAFALNIPIQTSPLIATPSSQSAATPAVPLPAAHPPTSSTHGVSPTSSRELYYSGKDIVRRPNAASIAPDP